MGGINGFGARVLRFAPSLRPRGLTSPIPTGPTPRRTSVGSSITNKSKSRCLPTPESAPAPADWPRLGLLDGETLDIVHTSRCVLNFGELNLYWLSLRDCCIGRSMDMFWMWDS